MKKLGCLSVLILLAVGGYMLYQHSNGFRDYFVVPQHAPPADSPAPVAGTPHPPPTPSAQPAPDQLAQALAAAQANADRARDACAKLTQAAKDGVKSSPQYQAAAKLEEDVKVARIDNDPDLPAISSKWIAAKSALAKLEAESLNSAEAKAATAEVAKTAVALSAARAAMAAHTQQPADDGPPVVGESIFSTHGKTGK